jgi:HSP20 family protein
MATVKHDEGKHEVASKRHDFLDRFFDDWSELFRHPVVFWPERGLDPMRVEEFSEEGTHIVRVEIAGIDPDKDIEVSVVGDVLHIGAERREEEKTEGRNYVRREHRYGSFHRDLPLPKGISESEIQATYKDGILEVRVPMTKGQAEAAKKIPVTKV